MRIERFTATLVFQRLAEFTIASIALFGWYVTHPHKAFCDPPRTPLAWASIVPHVVFEVGVFFLGFCYLPAATLAQVLTRSVRLHLLAPVLPAALFAPLAAFVVVHWPTTTTPSMWRSVGLASAAMLAADALIAARMRDSCS
jgi:hypothetical protein